MDFNSKIRILDGGLGSTMLKSIAEPTDEIKTFPELLTLDRPSLLYDVHTEFIKAGADILSTNTFSANEISLRQIDREDIVIELNQKSVEIARKAIEASSRNDILIAGSIGPSILSLTRDSSEQAKERLSQSYRRQIKTLCDAGADVLLFETFYDTLNAECAMEAVFDITQKLEKKIGVILSFHVTKEGSSAMGQSASEIKNIATKYPIDAFGLNCINGSEHLQEIVSTFTDLPRAIMVAPNSGVPDKNGVYPESADKTAEAIKQLMAKGMVNIVGGCCGTTPEYIHLISEIAKVHTSRKYN